MLFETNKGSFASALKNVGVEEGDILYVSSDIKTLLFNLAVDHGIKEKKERDAALYSFVDTLQSAVGEKGTLLFPVFSWDWCRGNGFNMRTTKGEVGTLSNWVLDNRPDFRRTRHPIYSFMVWGEDSDYLVKMDNQDAWSHSSPFYYFQTHGAKQLLFNIEAYQGFTFGHYIEQDVGVPYRHPKYFFGKYTGDDGITETRMYSMYVRDMDFGSGCGIHNDWLIENNVAKRIEWECNLLTVIDLQKSYTLIRDDMVNNDGMNTLTFTDGRLDWTSGQTMLYELEGIDA